MYKSYFILLFSILARDSFLFIVHVSGYLECCGFDFQTWLNGSQGTFTVGLRGQALEEEPQDGEDRVIGYE